jgi:putative peptidoglycan lipid II flippase
VNTSRQALARNAGVVMAAFVVSNVVGLVRQMLVSSAFGTSPQLDAFNAALRVPDLLFSLVAGGALASAFVPMFTGLAARGDDARAWRLTSALVNLVFLATLTVSAVTWLAAPWLVTVLVGRGFGPAQQALTVDLMRVLLATPVLFGLSGLLMGVQNARGRFLMPALAPSFYWLGMIIGLVLWAPSRGIFSLAWGAVLGALLYLGLQIVGMRGVRAPYTPGLGLDDAAVRQVGRLMGPRLLGVGANQLSFLVTTTLASYVAGGVSALDYAWRVFTMPQVVIAQGLAVAALPAFSALVARGELDQVRERLADTLIGMLFLAVPATVGLILLREPIVAMLFERGSFGPESTALVAAALGCFAVGLIGHSTVEIVSRAFYALQDTRTPVLVAGYTVLVNVALSLVLLVAFTRAGRAPVGGLALATSLAVTLEMLTLIWFLRRRLGGVGFARIGPALTRMVLASAVMGAVVLGWMALTAAFGPWFVGLGGAILGVGAYFAVALALGSAEARALAVPALERLHLPPRSRPRRRFDRRPPDSQP